VPAGLQTLVVGISGGQSNTVVVSVERGHATNVGEIVLGDAGQISGLITSSVGQSPIGGAVVTVIQVVASTDNQMPHPVRTAITDASGSYTIDGLPIGNYLISVSAAGYSAASLTATVTGGVTTPGDVSLTPTATAGTGALSGMVYLLAGDGSSAPIAGVLVRLVAQDTPSAALPLPATAVNSSGQPVSLYPGGVSPPVPRTQRDYYAFSGADGSYNISGVPAGQYTSVAVRPGLAISQHPVTITANTTVQQNFTLTMLTPTYGTITGTVTDAATNAPIAGAEVYAMICQPVSTGGGVASSAANAISNGAVITPNPSSTEMVAVTGTDGSYKLLVPACVTAIQASKNGYAANQVTVQVSVGGITVANIALTAVTPPATFTLSGTVSTESSNGALSPAPYAVVEADPLVAIPMGTTGGSSGGVMQPAGIICTANSTGAYHMSLQAGPYNIHASTSTSASAPVQESISADTVLNITIPPGPGNLPPTMLGAVTNQENGK
jgi:hypothetical protein